jgi:hypothetical protein
LLVANRRMQTASEREVDVAQTTGMLRAVVTEEDAKRKNGLPDNPDDYKTKLLKYIPAEAVALYTALVGIPVTLEEQSPGWYWFGLILVFAAGLAAVPLVLMKGYGMRWEYKKRQIILSIVAYILWVASIGTFQGIVAIPSAIVTIALGLFTFFVPWIDPGTNTSDVAKPTSSATG